MIPTKAQAHAAEPATSWPAAVSDGPDDGPPPSMPHFGGEWNVTPSAGRARVLVVDDEAAIVAVEREILKQAGYETVGVNSPSDALQLAPESFDAVVTDFKMPVIDGLTLFTRLRRRNPQLVGVLVTGYGTVQLVQTAMQAGFSGILLKPFPLDRLTAAVGRALFQRRMSEDNHRLGAILDVYAAAKDLHRARGRDELAGLLCELARRSIGADHASVLLADAEEQLLVRPHEGLPSDWTAWADGLVGGSILEALESVTYSEGGPVRLCLPLRCAEQIEGVLLLERREAAFDQLELERLSLLVSQGALALSHLRLFEEGLRDEKLAVVGRMAGAIVGQLREPVAAIDQAATTLVVDDEDYDYLEMIREQTTRLDIMCQELSDFVTGSDELSLAVCSLGELLSAAARRIRPALDQAGIEVTIEVDDDAMLTIDERKLGRALQNLLKNATEAMPDGGRLRLALELTEKHAALLVADSGVGMPPDVLERVFEPFYTRGKSRGTGLGGAVVRGAARAHGGDVEAASVVGEGSTFRIVLPRAGASSSTVGEEPGPAA